MPSMVSTTPGVIKTLDDIINRIDRYDVNKITFYAATDDKTLVVPGKNLFEMYFKYAAPYVGTFGVTDAERRYYQYKPYLLSQDVYGTPSLGWMILYLNDRESASRFYLKSTVNLIPPQVLPEVYDTIATRSSVRLKGNWNAYLPMIGEDIPK